jgi:acyl dehydratase
MAGLYVEDCHLGLVLRHRLHRTISEADNILFCSLTHNTQPLHLDAEYAARSEFGQRVVNSMLTLGLMVGISVSDTTEGTLIANLGLNDVSFPAPVFHGDTLRIESTVHGVRPSHSRPGAGVVEFTHQAFNQRDQLVARCVRAVLLHGRPAPAGKD